ncbi:reverse transcriptase domain, Reverse transcriptase zinc-binding domain protein [Artemisia annua]|uniref:Reverse transcriptase domain, Reverse transcriptase zinc-binding domain protein n=1 Tax=Artemisia annua TaxID=35608 RepID=A0A2U1PLD0_ARTAN|nr:reverse transcriptase domain, Reverse transcriptase zinc-binding domain protein [Artemisia annua]
MFKVVSKLKALKKPFRSMLFREGNIHEKVTKLRHELDEVQRALDLDPFNVDLREEEACYLNAFNEAVLKEECFLMQKAKVEWLRVGDSNSAYFHKVVKSRKARIRIDSICDGNGVQLVEDQVPNAFVSYFTSFVGQEEPVMPLDDSDLFTSTLDPNVALYMVRDVKDAIFSMGDDKAPGPDGSTNTELLYRFESYGHELQGQNLDNTLFQLGGAAANKPQSNVCGGETNAGYPDVISNLTSFVVPTPQECYSTMRSHHGVQSVQCLQSGVAPNLGKNSGSSANNIGAPNSQHSYNAISINLDSGVQQFTSNKRPPKRKSVIDEKNARLRCKQNKAARMDTTGVRPTDAPMCHIHETEVAGVPTIQLTRGRKRKGPSVNSAVQECLDAMQSSASPGVHEDSTCTNGVHTQLFHARDGHHSDLGLASPSNYAGYI